MNLNDSTEGRWLSPDPSNAGAHASNPQTWNAYSYALNNPTTLTDPEGTDVHVCLDNPGGGQSCSWYSDEEYAKYASAENASKQGISAPVGSAQNLGHPNGNITCGGSVCGSVTYGEAPSKDVTGGLVNFGLLVAGGANLVRGAVDLGEGAINGIRSLLESETPEAEPLGLRTAGAMEGRALPALNRLSPKIQSQMVTRGWTRQDILDVFEKGQPNPVIDRTAGGVPATQYLDPATGRFIVVNDATGNVIQVSGPGFQPNLPTR